MARIVVKPGFIPCDEDLRQMTREQINTLANSLTTQAQLEWLSDALLRIHQGWKSGAYSESAGTDHNRRIVGNEIQFSQMEHPEFIRVPIPDHEVRHLIGRGVRAGLSRKQQLIFTLYETGYSQTRIAKLLNIHQSTVSRYLTEALEELWNHIDNHDSYKMFFEESHRSHCFKLTNRPTLPGWLEHARRVIEETENVSTSIQQDAKSTVEIWTKTECIQRLTTGQARARAKKIRLFLSKAA